MKRSFAVITLLLLLAAALGQAQAAQAPGFIPVTSATASSNYAVRYPFQACNGAGIAETMTGLKCATHDNVADNGWLTSNATSIDQQWIEFDLGAAHNISQMWVWNLNQSGSNYKLRALKNVIVEYKTNLTDAYTLLGGTGTFTLGLGTGISGLMATNQTTGQPIDFGGASARFVRIRINGVVGVGSYGGNDGAENYAGLAEVRFYEGNAVQPYVQPSAVSFPRIRVGTTTTSLLGVGAFNGTGTVSLTGYSIDPNGRGASAFSWPTPPAFPVDFTAPNITTYTLAFSPTAAVLGNYQTTLTLNMTVGGTPQTLKVPLSASAWDYAAGFIPNVTATHSSAYPATGPLRTAAQLTNNSGINTEVLVGSKFATHNNTANSMWLNAGTGYPIASSWVEFDLGAAHPLAEMWVWNYNEASYSVRGVKNAKVAFKLNSGDAWTYLNGGADITFQATAPGQAYQTPATNLVSGQPVSFGGVSARYARIEVSGTNGVGNYGDSTYVGLSEVRFYEAATSPYLSPAGISLGNVPTGQVTTTTLVLGATGGSGSIVLTGKSVSAGAPVTTTIPATPITYNANTSRTYVVSVTPPVAGAFTYYLNLNLTLPGGPTSVQIPITGTATTFAPYFIRNVQATASTLYLGDPAMYLVDGRGMTEAGGVIGSQGGTHSATHTDMWLTNTAPVSGQWVEFDLGGIHPLREMWIWNYNQSGGSPAYNTRGTQDCRIYYKRLVGDTWTQLGGTFTLKIGTGTAGMAATNLSGSGLPISFGDLPIGFVRLEVASNYGDTANYVGLSEVRFYEAPPTPKAAVSAASLSFPSVNVELHQSPTQLTLDINSIGTADLSITGLTINGTDAVDFGLVSPPALPVSVVPGAKQTLTLRFAPHQTVITPNINANLAITTNDPLQGTINVPLRGDAVPVGMSNFSVE